MTLILTCLTQHFTVQASDRRLTATTGNQVEVIEDQSNKALIYSNHFAFAYTGLARLPKMSAIDWAGQQLSEKKSLGDAILHLGNRASDLINSDQVRNFYSRCPASVKRLAFVGAGFAQPGKVDPFVKTGGRADVRATLLLFLSRYGLFLQLFYCFSG